MPSLQRKRKISKEQIWIIPGYVEVSKIKMMVLPKSRVERILKNKSQIGMDFVEKRKQEREREKERKEKKKEIRRTVTQKGTGSIYNVLIILHFSISTPSSHR